MASAPDQSLSDAASSLGRSSSIDARDGALPRSDSQRRSTNKLGRKGGRSGNDLFVCFAPRTTLNLVSANRPVVSPARDKGKETGSARRSSRGSSIFSSKAPSKKQGYDDVEEPTSPKVTCIGQVRSKSKHDKKHKGSPAAPRKQRSSAQAEGKKESACPSFAKDFSCFGLPCDSYGSLPSFRGDKKSSGTVFAKSLVLIQREDEGKMVAMEASTTAKLRVPSFPEASSGGDVSAIGKPGLKEEEIHAEILPVLQESISVMGVPGSSCKAEALQGKEIAEDQTSNEEDDTFEAEPPPANALLLMRSKVEHLRVLVPPPSINITLKRSTSAPAHCRRKSEDGDDNGQSQAPDNADQTTSMDAKRETSSVLISSEDLPKPSNATKSFLQRCKSVSRSLSRSSSERVEETKASPVTQEVKAAGGPNAWVENNILDEHNDELHLMSEALSRRRSDSEALKVSLDIVPETWLWEARALTRKEQKEKTGSGRRLEMKQAGGQVAEWLDGELEAALWKSCQVGDSVRHPPISRNDILRSTDPSVADSCANQGLDAEVEATLWQCCSLVASHSSQELHSESKTPEIELKRAESESKVDGSCMESVAQSSSQEGKIEENVKQATIKDDKASHQGSNAVHSSNLGRSSSVGSHCGKHLLERGSSLRRSASVGAGRQHADQQERARSERRKSKEQTKNERIIHKQSSHELAREGHMQIDDVHIGVATSERYATTCIVEAELWCAGRHSNGHSDRDTSLNDSSRLPDADNKDASAEVQNASEEEAVDAEDIAAPSPSSVLDRPVPPPSPAPATPPEAVLFVRYDIGAFRISLDGPTKMEPQAADHHHQQQKAMLEAISHLHIHDVQRTYARLLKAASGKERASLSSAAFRLQRCKSEPVRLASY